MKLSSQEYQLRNITLIYYKLITKLRDLSPRANYTDRATAACRLR
jgi:hypothetical protein